MASIELPEDERFVVEGRIDDIRTGGGGYDFAPTTSQLFIGGKSVTIRNNDYCYPCGPFGRRGTGYGKGSVVVVSLLHSHYVVRQVPATPTQTACGAR